MSIDSDYVERLWADYKSAPSRPLRDQLILHYAPLVKFVASRIATNLPSSVDQGDLASYGMFGLIDAIEKFEPQRGFKFETYATARVKGAIYDELRSIDWVPRSVRTKAKAVEAAYATLEASLHRAPTDAELSVELDLTEEQLQITLGQISAVGLAALDERVSGGNGERDYFTLGDMIADRHDGPVARYEEKEIRTFLAESINRMSDRERIVLTLYYFENMTLAEIGEVLSVTESRVSQIHGKAVLALKARMDAFSRAVH
ncbi:MAG: FliA/WhiG family RNA polymerase sigma factor [Acidimicrobiia bacterium]